MYYSKSTQNFNSHFKPALESQTTFKLSLKKKKALFTQLIGLEGSGSRRLALDFIPSHQTVVWMSSQWKLYAPLLWSLAKERGLEMFGLECPERKKFRSLWRELYEVDFFDTWVLDYMSLKTPDIIYLHQLLSATNKKVIVLESYPLSFCQERIHISLSHDQHKLQWSKPKSFRLESKPAEYLKWVREDAPFSSLKAWPGAEINSAHLKRPLEKRKMP